MEFLAWWVLISQVFAQKSTAVKWNCCILQIDIAPGPQKVPELYFQRQVSMSKIIWIFSRKISSKNINLGDHFLLKTFFSRLNFWTTLLSKIRPNFCRPHTMSIHKIQQFHLNTVYFWAKALLFRTHQARNSMA